MKANLYLLADTLKYNGTDSEEEFNDKFVSLLDDLNEIRNQYGLDNTIKVSSSLSDGSVALFGEKNIYDMAANVNFRITA